MKSRWLLGLALITLAVACRAPMDKRTPYVRYDDVGLSQQQVLSKEQRDNGLIIEVLRRGQGSPISEGDHLYLHFTGWLQQPFKKFDSTIDRGGYLEYIYGLHSINPGWDEGIADMRVGGKRRLRMPSSLGYGDKGQGPVPPNKALIYEIELLKVKGKK